MSVDNHYLQPLLAPRSIALLGASNRDESVGEMMMRQLIEIGFPGELYPVNPRYEEVSGLTCYGSLAELPASVELAVLNLAGHRIEAAMTEAITLGIKAFVIFDPCQPDDDPAPGLIERIRAIARESGVAICGGNGMGYSNFDAKCFVGMWVQPPHPAGAVSLIAHSGSVFMFANADAPNYFNLSVSAGQELGTSMDEYMDYALAMPSTRAIALFAETIRNPEGFHASLAKSREQQVPVVVCKLGRTEAAARQAVNHTGAIAGDNEAFDALLDHYDALRVDTLDQLLSAATLLASPNKPPPDGGFALFTDSGGLCGLAADRGEALGVEFPSLSRETCQKLKELLPLTTPDNPFDATLVASSDFRATYREAFGLMASDPNVSLFCVDSFADDRYDSRFSTGEAALDVFAAIDKPMFLISTYTGFPNGRLMQKSHEAGAPFVFGIDNALAAARCFLQYHRRLSKTKAPVIDADKAVVPRWRDILANTRVLGEHQSLSLFQAFGVPVVECEVAQSTEELRDAAETLGYPVALKTAAQDIHHKSDVDGVVLGLKDADELEAAYQSLSSRLGPKVLVSVMADPGVELALGMFTDPTAGPVVVVGPGGTLIEYFDERVFAIPPFDIDTAKDLVFFARENSPTRTFNYITESGIRGRLLQDTADAPLKAKARGE